MAGGKLCVVLDASTLVLLIYVMSVMKTSFSYPPDQVGVVAE